MSDTKTCPFCAEEIKAAAIKCRYCDEMLADRPEDADEVPEDKVLFHGPGSQWLNLGTFILALLLSVTLLLGSFWVISAFDVGIWASLVGILLIVPAVMVARAYLRTKHTVYTVTTLKIQVERGWLSKHIDQIDILRLRDVELRQSIVGRLFGVGNILVIAHDPTDPHFVLRGLTKPRQVYDTIQAEALTALRRGKVVQLQT